MLVMAPFVIAEPKSQRNGNMFLYTTEILVSLLVIAIVVIVVLVCRQKIKTGAYIHNSSTHTQQLYRKTAHSLSTFRYLSAITP